MEGWDQDPSFKVTDPEFLSPVRLGAKLMFLQALPLMTKLPNLLGDSTVTFQGRTLAKQTATDDRLKVWGMYIVGSDHIRDSTRHAVTALRRAREKEAFRDQLWPNAKQ